MGRLSGKNILVVIPKDYYNEEEFDRVVKPLKEEDANVLVASKKFKEAVGEKDGHIMPDLLIVDAIEGITGDSYVSGSRGTRQVKGVFHGVVLIGGRGARSYLWKDNLLCTLIHDRHRSGFVVGAIGMAVGCLATSGLAESMEVAAPEDKNLLNVLEKGKSVLAEETMTQYNRILSARSADDAGQFCQAFIEEVEKTPLK